MGLSSRIFHLAKGASEREQKSIGTSGQRRSRKTRLVDSGIVFRFLAFLVIFLLAAYTPIILLKETRRFEFLEGMVGGCSDEWL